MAAVASARQKHHGPVFGKTICAKWRVSLNASDSWSNMNDRMIGDAGRLVGSMIAARARCMIRVYLGDGSKLARRRAGGFPHDTRACAPLSNIARLTQHASRLGHEKCTICARLCVTPSWAMTVWAVRQRPGERNLSTRAPSPSPPAGWVPCADRNRVERNGGAEGNPSVGARPCRQGSRHCRRENRRGSVERTPIGPGVYPRVWSFLQNLRTKGRAAIFFD
jgi:hypothetical protein